MPASQVSCHHGILLWILSNVVTLCTAMLIFIFWNLNTFTPNMKPKTCRYVIYIKSSDNHANISVCAHSMWLCVRISSASMRASVSFSTAGLVEFENDLWNCRDSFVFLCLIKLISNRFPAFVLLTLNLVFGLALKVLCIVKFKLVTYAPTNTTDIRKTKKNVPCWLSYVSLCLDWNRVCLVSKLCVQNTEIPHIEMRTGRVFKWSVLNMCWKLQVQTL